MTITDVDVVTCWRNSTTEGSHGSTANSGWARGFDVDQDEDMTIFGPFGSLLRGTAELAGRQDRAARLFNGGSGRCEVIKTVVSGDVVVVVQVERSEARVQGSQEAQPWVLRTTQVSEQRGDRWVRLHRHADPLIELRSPELTFAIARGEVVPADQTRA